MEKKRDPTRKKKESRRLLQNIFGWKCNMRTGNIKKKITFYVNIQQSFRVLPLFWIFSLYSWHFHFVNFDQLFSGSLSPLSTIQKITTKLEIRSCHSGGCSHTSSDSLSAIQTNDSQIIHFLAKHLTLMAFQR